MIIEKCWNNEDGERRCLTFFRVLNALPKKHNVLEHLDGDTMPLYLSNVIVFMALGYLLERLGSVDSIVISAFVGLFCLIIFSTKISKKF